VRRALAAALCALLVPLSACGGGDDDDAAAGASFRLTVAPQFVQGAYPGVATGVLVRADGGGDAVDLRASVSAGDVRVTPASVRPGQVAEVTFVGPPVTAQEKTVTLRITATRGEVVRTAMREIVVMPGENTLDADARRVLALFLPSLARDHPELGLDPGDLATLEGRVVAPRLLVVSHYAFFSDRFELGLSWHIMIAPDDWTELYVRPLDALAPTLAFKIGSWSTALNGGAVAVTEVDPPEEIVR
jgi:hypothetical protein